MCVVGAKRTSRRIRGPVKVAQRSEWILRERKTYHSQHHSFNETASAFLRRMLNERCRHEGVRSVVQGEMVLGAKTVRGSGRAFRGHNPATQEALAPDFHPATAGDLEAACAMAAAAAPVLRSASREVRANLLDAIGSRLKANGEAIVERAMAETGLPKGRIEGELGRTVNQLALFARVVREGGYLDLRIDTALPDRVPPRPDIRLSMVPVGPVVVFGASNFPLAFSVAGGDTASALAAGCPVIVKAHSAHPGTSELAGKAIQAAVADVGLPEGVFSLLFGSGSEIGGKLVADARIKAVGFTGSRQGGLALVEIARKRAEPIPVYAEMSSINPVLLLPGALAAKGPQIAQAFAGSLTLGAGQFCTNPGLLIAIDGPECDAFAEAATAAVGALAGATMLTAGIHSAYCKGVGALEANPRAALVARGQEAGGLTATPVLFAVPAADFLADHSLHEEVFGAASLLVKCRNEAEVEQVLRVLEGQLTLAIHAHGDADQAMAGRLLPLAEQKAGRILFNGFGTGVEVCDAMVHGGPWPATSDPRSTSVGSLAISRFVRPVSYQDTPQDLLPPDLRDDAPEGLARRVNGKIIR